MSYLNGQPPKDGTFYRVVATNRAYYEDDRKVTFTGLAKFGIVAHHGKQLYCWHDKNNKPIEGQIVRHWIDVGVSPDAA